MTVSNGQYVDITYRKCRSMSSLGFTLFVVLSDPTGRSSGDVGRLVCGGREVNETVNADSLVLIFSQIPPVLLFQCCVCLMKDLSA